MQNDKSERGGQSKWPLIILPPLLVFLKDVIAINAVLATEPGITARTKMLFAFSQLPGALFLDEATSCMLFNLSLALGVGGLIYCREALRSSRRTA
jgi:hypothetical protein